MSDSIEQFPHLEDLVRAADKAEIQEEAMRVVLRAEQHHQHIRDQLQQIVTHADRGASIELGEGGPKVAAGTDLHKGFVLGMRMAHHLVGDFPLKVMHPSEMPDDEEG